jgi:predicted esterase
MRYLLLVLMSVGLAAGEVVNLTSETTVPTGYIVELPEGYDSTRSYPLIVAIHGFGDRMAAYVGTNDRLCPEGAIGLYPESPYPMPSDEPGPLGFTWEIWTDSTHWLAGHATSEASIGWILRSIELVKERYPVDPDKVFLFGFSQGGWLTFQVGLREPQLFAGLLPAGGWLSWDSAQVLAPAALETPVRILHGVNDDMCEFKGAQLAFDTLSGRGVPVELMRYPAKHELTRELLEDARDFVWRVLHEEERLSLTGVLYPEDAPSPGERLRQLDFVLVAAEPTEEIEKGLLALYETEPVEVKEKLIYLLGARRCSGAEELLRQALQGAPDARSEPRLRQAAYSALIKLGTESAWQTVRETELEVAVRGVVPGSQAAEVGLKPGDAILTYDGRPIGAPGDISAAKAAVEEGQEEVEMAIRRNGEEIKLTLKPGSIGIWTEQRPR